MSELLDKCKQALSEEKMSSRVSFLLKKTVEDLEEWEAAGGLAIKSIREENEVLRKQNEKLKHKLSIKEITLTAQHTNYRQLQEENKKLREEIERLKK